MIHLFLSVVKKTNLSFALLIAIMLTGCFSNKISYSFVDTYQNYSDQKCNLDYEKAFQTLIDKVEIFQSRAGINGSLISFLRELEPLEHQQSSSCFFEAEVILGIPFYGKEPTNYPIYYEIWVTSALETDQIEICAGANPIGWSYSGEQPYATLGIKTPKNYKDGYAKKTRYLPVCLIKEQ